MPLPPPLTITEKAAHHVKHLMNQGGEDVQGLRVGIKSGGCSGYTYFVEYAKERQGMEDVVEDKGVKVFIEPKAIMFLLGSTMDYEKTTFSERFIFTNPNEKGRCGCGESIQF